MQSYIFRLPVTLLLAVLALGAGYPEHAKALVWQNPPIQFTNTGSGREAQVATDGAGNAITLWTDSSVPNVQASYFSAETETYGSIATLFTGNFAQDLDLAMDASGTGLAIWSVPALNAILTSYFDGSAWVSPTPNPLTVVTDGSNTYSSLAMDGSGRGVATWIEAGTSTVLASFFAAGQWSPPTPIGTGTIDTSVIYSSNGSAAAVWSNAGAVTVATFNGFAWQLPVILGSTLAEPTIGIDANGNVLVTWIDNPSGAVLYSFFNGTIWSVVQPISIIGGNSNVELAMAPTGTAVAIWLDTLNHGQYSQFNGSSWTLPISFGGATPADFTSIFMDVGVDSNGNAVIVWESNPPGAIYSAYLPIGGTLGPADLISNVLAINNIEVVLSDDGRAFASWDQAFAGEGVSNVFASYTLFVPTPPFDIDGRVCHDRFAYQSDYVHIITWTPSSDPTVLGYFLRRNGELIAIIPASGPFIYYDHSRSSRVEDTYVLTAVNLAGESSPLIITLQ